MARRGKGLFGPMMSSAARKVAARLAFTVLPYAFSIALVAVLGWSSATFAIQSDLFLLKQVTLENGRALSADAAWRFAGLRTGTPVFQIDLAAAERIARSRNPEFKDIWVKRVLPDEVRIHLVRRAPVAQIQSEAFYLVDAEGLIVSEGQGAPFGNLPVIRGAKLKPAQLHKGMKVDHAALRAVQLFKDIRRFDVLHGHRLSAVDISHPDNLILWVNEKIELRVSSRNLTSQMKKISDALANIDLDPEKVQYIDLRFDDIVIGPR